MTFQLSLRALAGLSLGVLGLVSVVGCQGVITRGGEGGGGSGGDGTGATFTTNPGTGGGGGEGQCDPGACPTPALAMSHAQFAAGVGEDPNGGVLTDTQYLLYGGGTQTPACDAPFGSSACGGWTVALSLPTSMLTPGTYSFLDPEVDIFFSESFETDTNSCAGGGGGGFEDGELTILQVSDTTVLFEVTGVSETGSSFSTNGFYSAARCSAE